MGKQIRRAALLALAILAAATSSSALTLAGSDDFADDVVDPSLWGADLGSGGTLSETNQRLEYSVSPSADALLIRPWILSSLSYDEYWQVQVDVHVGNVELALDGQDLLFGVGIVAGDAIAAVNLEFENIGGTLLRGFHAVNEGPGGLEVMAATTTTDGAVLLRFDATTKQLSYAFDEDGSAGGYAWTFFQTVDLDAPGTDWGLSGGAVFSLGLFGESHAIAVASGDAFGDDFLVVPEPSPATLVAVGLLAMTARRTPRRPALRLRSS
jgi:hypothetical protein